MARRVTEASKDEPKPDKPGLKQVLESNQIWYG